MSGAPEEHRRMTRRLILMISLLDASVKIGRKCRMVLEVTAQGTVVAREVQ